ncbi:MAG TPA: hypothetical protein ENK11_00860, partial [Phycisphaerales bacterium]|nr:hypothetical protein [Phycisphaerales bacterium]
MLLIVIALVGGCAGTRSATGIPADPGGAQRPPGLEARSWRIDALDGTLYRALAPHALEEPEGTGRWRDAGIRLIRVPRDEIDPLEAVLPHVNAVHRAMIGEPTVWTPLASAGVGSGRAFDIPGGRRAFGRGRLELLVRGWHEPVLRGDTAFRVELALAWLEEGTTRPEVLDHLVYSGSIGADEAFVIVAAPPGEHFVSWVGPLLEESGIQPGPQPGPPADAVPTRKNGGLAPLPAPAIGEDDSA